MGAEAVQMAHRVSFRVAAVRKPVTWEVKCTKFELCCCNADIQAV